MDETRIKDPQLHAMWCKIASKSKRETAENVWFEIPVTGHIQHVFIQENTTEDIVSGSHFIQGRWDNGVI